jgi:hypothetical protein
MSLAFLEKGRSPLTLARHRLAAEGSRKHTMNCIYTKLYLVIWGVFVRPEASDCIRICHKHMK